MPETRRQGNRERGTSKLDRRYRNLPWNKAVYKPTTKICEDFWDEFIRTALILRIIDKNRSKEEKASPSYRDPDIYSVFNKLRQDIHDELPYSTKFIQEIDLSVEREVQKEIKLYERKTGGIISGVSNRG